MPPVSQAYRNKVSSTVRELHARGWNDRMISAEIGLAACTVHSYRKQLGLNANYTITPGTVRSDNKIHPHRDRIVEVLREGWSDGYIARELNLSRRELNHYRRKHLQIEALPRKQQLDRCSGRRSQERSMGCTPAEHQASLYWSIAPQLGWPMGLRFRAVQMLELLLNHPGGLTRVQIRDALQLTDKRMMSNDPQGTYLANLIARELVASAARVIPTGRLVHRKGSAGLVASGQNVHLYFATPLAFETKSRWRAAHGAGEQSLLDRLAKLGHRKPHCRRAESVD